MENLDFIYNDNYDRRGVWHITDNLEVKVIPASIRMWEEPGYRAKWSTSHEYRYPECEIAKGDAICGQVTCTTGSVNILHTPIREGTIAIYRGRVRPAYYQRGLDNPPQPLCVRCARKAGLDI